MRARKNADSNPVVIAGGWLAIALLMAGGVADGRTDGIPQAGPSVAPSRPPQTQVSDPGRGFVPPGFDLPPVETEPPQLPSPLVDRFDWRESGVLTPIKNQGACGSCYAFAAVASFESRVLIDGGGTYDFSENNIKECEYFGSSCSGGNYWRVANHLAAVGTVLETCDPYVAANVTCKTTCPAVKTLLDWREFSHDTPASVAAIKAYLQTYGPIYTAMYAGSGDAWNTEFNNYNGSYTLYYAGAGSSNHAVLIVGWDDNLTHAGGTGGWIVRNSWGASWGGSCGYGTERGYFYIAYGSAQIGTWASFLADWQDADADGFYYYYDEAGYVGSVGYGVTTAWGFCKYIPADDIVLRLIEFWTADATTDVDVYVYDTFSGVSLSGQLASKLNSSFDLPGYHSVELTTAPRVTAGNDIYVVVKLTDASYKYPLVFDSVGPKSSGTSYISSNGSSWSEWTGGDLGIRLRAGEDPSCGTIIVPPIIADVIDVPGDNGRHVRLSWRRSIYDDEGSSPEVRRYKVWRRVGAGEGQMLGAPRAISEVPAEAAQGEFDESGPVWELVAVVHANGSCTYTLDAPTECDGPSCVTQFYISAHTGVLGQHFDSPPDSGYSVDNLFTVGDNDATPGPPAPGPKFDGATLFAPTPNPGPGGFAIGFGLDSPDWVRLDIYDISGRRVAGILDEYAEAGLHSAAWGGLSGEGAPVAPGIYFVRLLTSSRVHTAKLAVTR